MLCCVFCDVYVRFYKFSSLFSHFRTICSSSSSTTTTRTQNSGISSYGHGTKKYHRNVECNACDIKHNCGSVCVHFVVMESNDERFEYYLLAKKPNSKETPTLIFDKMLQCAVTKLQPGSPVYVHVEILRFDKYGSLHKVFSAYEGQQSAWYQINSKYREEEWTALPLCLIPSEKVQLEERALLCSGAEYSYKSFLKSFYGLRILYKHYDCNTALKAPGHCANLVARVLKGSAKFSEHLNNDTYYGPSTLYRDSRVSLVLPPCPFCKHFISSPFSSHREWLSILFVLTQQIFVIVIIIILTKGNIIKQLVFTFLHLLLQQKQQRTFT